jgi:hypothetical protein
MRSSGTWDESVLCDGGAICMAVMRGADIGVREKRAGSCRGYGAAQDFLGHIPIKYLKHAQAWYLQHVSVFAIKIIFKQ